MLIFLILVNLTIGKMINEIPKTPDHLTYSDDDACGIINCVKCHKGWTGQACDKCVDGYGVDKKAIGDDLCVLCASAVNHCQVCSNTKIWWNCLACETGYRVIQMPTADDLCVPTG